jgi:hypothetical protein
MDTDYALALSIFIIIIGCLLIGFIYIIYQIYKSLQQNQPNIDPVDPGYNLI